MQTKIGPAAGVFYYTYTDHLGNVVALSTTGGALVANSLARFDPFGNYRTLPSTNPGTTNHGFTGHRHNNTGVYPTLNVGLIYMNARYYLPEVGRFISADSIVPNPSNPQSFNRYSYVRNSPMNFTDPSGHRECMNSDATGCTFMAPNQPSPTPTLPASSSVPNFIPSVPPFDALPFDPADIFTGNSMQGFGDTTNAFENRTTDYQYLGRLHGGWDIPMPSGTSLLALGQGTVICAGEDCGLDPDSGNGFGIAIRYDSCNCVVFYLHLSSFTEGLGEGSTVTSEMVVGTSGEDKDGHQHLHLEIRPERGTFTFYNPLYFFTSEALSTIPNDFMGYQGSSNQWRIYGYTSSVDGKTFGSFWEDTLPELWVRR